MQFRGVKLNSDAKTLTVRHRRRRRGVDVARAGRARKPVAMVRGDKGDRPPARPLTVTNFN